MEQHLAYKQVKQYITQDQLDCNQQVPRTDQAEQHIQHAQDLEQQQIECAPVYDNQQQLATEKEMLQVKEVVLLGLQRQLFAESKQ